MRLDTDCDHTVEHPRRQPGSQHHQPCAAPTQPCSSQSYAGSMVCGLRQRRLLVPLWRPQGSLWLQACLRLLWRACRRGGMGATPPGRRRRRPRPASRARRTLCSAARPRAGLRRTSLPRQSRTRCVLPWCPGFCGAASTVLQSVCGALISLPAWALCASCERETQLPQPAACQPGQQGCRPASLWVRAKPCARARHGCAWQALLASAPVHCHAGCGPPHHSARMCRPR